MGDSKTINPDTMEPFGSDPANLLSPMHFAINDTVKIVSAVKEPSLLNSKKNIPLIDFLLVRFNNMLLMVNMYISFKLYYAYNRHLK